MSDLCDISDSVDSPRRFRSCSVIMFATGGGEAFMATLLETASIEQEDVVEVVSEDGESSSSSRNEVLMFMFVSPLLFVVVVNSFSGDLSIIIVPCVCRSSGS